MGVLGKVVFVLFVAFMLFFIWSVKDVAGAERRLEWYVVLCAKASDGTLKTRPCVFRSAVVPYEKVTPFKCHRYGQFKVVELLKQHPTLSIKKFGCRRESLEA